MKILMYSVRDDEISAIRDWEKSNNSEIDIITDILDDDTVYKAEGYDGICIQQMPSIGSEEVYKKLASYSIQQISLRTAGYDVVDLNLAKKYDLKITNVPAYSPYSVAELVLAQSLRLLRNLEEFQKRSDAQNFTWGGLMAREIRSLKVGIIGAGKIGGTVAKIFSALGADVIAYDPVERDDLKSILTYQKTQEDVLRQANVVTIHVPLLESTTNLITKDSFKQMKNDAIFLNAARGPVVDTDALISALENKEIAGAALDTITNEGQFFKYDLSGEKLTDKNLVTLRKMDNVLITPHIGFYTNIAVQNMVDISLDAVKDILTTGESSVEIHS